MILLYGNQISKEDAAYDDTIAVIKELQLRISAAVKEYIKGNENIFVDTIQMREEHKARFGCRIEIDREAKTFKVFPFIVALGGDSRSNRYEVEEHPGEDDEEEIRDMDREALGFQPLGSYESYLEDNLPDSSFYADIIAKFEIINGLYRKYDDCCISFDELLTELNAANPKETIKLIYERLLKLSQLH